MRTRPPSPTATAAGTVSPAPMPCTKPATSPRNPSASTENPKSLGSWPTRMVRARPFMYPIMRRLRDQVGDEPELADPGHQGDRADHQRQDRAERDRACRVAVRRDQREHGGGDHRPQRRVRAEHQDPRRPEHRIPEQAQDRRVQAGDRRQPGELGVGHALRHQQRGQHQPGDQIPSQPPRLIGGQEPEPRNDGDRLHAPPPLLTLLPGGGAGPELHPSRHELAALPGSKQAHGRDPGRRAGLWPGSRGRQVGGGRDEWALVPEAPPEALSSKELERT